MTAVDSQITKDAEHHHRSVLLEEAMIALLGDRENPVNSVFVDGTLGGGGHAKAICDRLNESNHFIGFDQDPVALEVASMALKGVKPKVSLIHANFSQMKDKLAELGVESINGGVLLDLGYSAFQIRSPERGFSFQHDAALDMRMNPEQEKTAAIIVNEYDESKLARIFYDYADERLSRPIAREIVENRPINTTMALADLVKRVYAEKGCKIYNIHPATRVFQALRMEVNQELNVLKLCLDQCNDLLVPGARIAVITFHSVEDSSVKEHFRWFSSTCVCPPDFPDCICMRKPLYRWTKKAIIPSDTEIAENPQARSAKLRVAEKIL